MGRIAMPVLHEDTFLSLLQTRSVRQQYNEINQNQPTSCVQRIMRPFTAISSEYSMILCIIRCAVVLSYLFSRRRTRSFHTTPQGSMLLQPCRSASMLKAIDDRNLFHETPSAGITR